MARDSDDQSAEDVVDEFLERRGHVEETWIEDGEKVQCPECSAVHAERESACRVCGWQAE